MISELEKVYSGALSLLEDRGYKIDPKYYTSKTDIGNSIIIENENILVYIVTDINISVSLKVIRNIVNFAINKKVKNLIIIGKKIKLDIRIKAYLKNISITVDLLSYALLIINPLKHILVPPHRILKQNEKIAIFKDSRIKKEHLPKIYKTDPVIMWLGGKIGDVVKIERNIGKLMVSTSLKQNIYRIIIDPELINDGLKPEHDF